MSEPKPLTTEQRETLRRELARDDLAVYTVVRMAREAVDFGRFDEAVARLRVDADRSACTAARSTTSSPTDTAD